MKLQQVPQNSSKISKSNHFSYKLTPIDQKNNLIIDITIFHLSNRLITAISPLSWFICFCKILFFFFLLQTQLETKKRSLKHLKGCHSCLGSTVINVIGFDITILPTNLWFVFSLFHLFPVFSGQMWFC